MIISNIYVIPAAQSCRHFCRNSGYCKRCYKSEKGCQKALGKAWCLLQGNERIAQWGDFARTIVLQNGVTEDMDDIGNQEWKQGLLMEEYLHNEPARFAGPETTFEELYYHMNGLIEAKGLY